jgi:pSer/pThr/pTyr-binding forkhead associated (FHA) protein
MSKKTLVIDGTDQEHFFLTVDSGTLRIGHTAAHPEGVVRDMRVVRIHCELEVEDDRENVPIDEPGVLAPSTLSPGSSVKLGHASLTLVPGSQTFPVFQVPAESPLVLPPPPPADDGFQLDLSLTESDSSTAQQVEAPTVVPRRFKVIDGGDQGRCYKLPDEGTITVGKPGHANLGLHDLYVSKVHCSVHIEGYRVQVAHHEGQNGTLIDGMRISGPQKLRQGSVLRVGNSHLKLEHGPFTDDLPPIDEEDQQPKPEGSGSKRVVAQKSTDPVADLDGLTIGHFTLGKLLHRGFTSAVYRATDTKSGHDVVLKVLDPVFPASGAELEHFAKEFKAAQAVRHANILTLLGAGKSGNYFWYSREFVEGESAADVVKRVGGGEKPSWTKAARVAVHLARALYELKKAKLVHGNITPRNVLLRTEDHVTKLADLRLAQALDGSQLQQAVHEKKLLAELAYMAPEQTNSDGFVDGLADLYAIGSVAYALIVGKPPFLGTKKDELIARVQNARIAPPSATYKKVPPEFDAIVMKLLSRKQEERYQTPSSLLKDLEPLADSYDLKL